MGVKVYGQTNKKYRRKSASILFSATVGDNTLHLRSRVNGFSCTINWGDGDTSICPADGGNIIHNYAVAGDYIISIYGDKFSGFYVFGQTGKEKYKELYSMGKWKSLYTYCMGNAFYGCGELIKVHSNAFLYFSTVVSFEGVFRNCAKLETIPQFLFESCISAISFGYVFSGCYKLKVLSDIFGLDFDNHFNGKTISFTNSFARISFSGEQGIAPDLWNFAGLTATKTGCFGGVGNNAASLSNYADIPAEWK